MLAVTSGSFALTMLERNRPDLIVSRVGVPDIDGYELCSIVRKDPLMTGVLFLLLASPGDEAAATMLEGQAGPDARGRPAADRDRLRGGHPARTRQGGAGRDKRADRSGRAARRCSRSARVARP